MPICEVVWVRVPSLVCLFDCSCRSLSVCGSFLTCLSDLLCPGLVSTLPVHSSGPDNPRYHRAPAFSLVGSGGRHTPRPTRGLWMVPGSSSRTPTRLWSTEVLSGRSGVGPRVTCSRPRVSARGPCVSPGGAPTVSTPVPTRRYWSRPSPPCRLPSWEQHGAAGPTAGVGLVEAHQLSAVVMVAEATFVDPSTPSTTPSVHPDRRE